MKQALLAIAVFTTFAAPATAQPLGVDHATPPLPTVDARRVADVISWGTALTGIALDAKASWDAPDRQRALALQGVRLGATYGAAQAIKRLVHRTRPCSSLPEGCGDLDADASFYSMHTAFAAQAIGGPRLVVALPLAVGTGGLRVAAGKHYLTDVATGALAGWLVGRIR